MFIQTSTQNKHITDYQFNVITNSAIDTFIVKYKNIRIKKYQKKFFKILLNENNEQYK